MVSSFEETPVGNNGIHIFSHLGDTSVNLKI